MQEKGQINNDTVKMGTFAFIQFFGNIFLHLQLKFIEVEVV